MVETEARIEQVTQAMSLDPHAVAAVSENTSALFNGASGLAEDLRYSLAKGVKIYNETLETYKAKLRNLGIPTGACARACVRARITAVRGRAGARARVVRQECWRVRVRARTCTRMAPARERHSSLHEARASRF